jgi:hypothetical protein
MLILFNKHIKHANVATLPANMALKIFLFEIQKVIEVLHSANM